jgi:glycosyltransferase involved in cell wall biosynthesis
LEGQVEGRVEGRAEDTGVAVRPDGNSGNRSVAGSTGDSAAAATLSESARADFAVVVPAFDEVEVVGDLVREMREAFRRHDLHGEVLLVDDGSTDGTAERAEREGAGWDNLRVLRHRTNMGKTEAILTATAATDRTYLVVFDADLQHSPDEIPRFLAKLEEGRDIVTGRKVGEYGKQAVSSIYNRLSRAVFRVPVSDLNSMKAFRREILEEIHLRHDWHRFFVVLAHARGFSVSEIDIPLYPRRAGTSKYSGRFRIVVGLMDLLSVWFLLLFSRKPLLLFGFTGLALIVLGIAVGAVAIYFRFAHQMGFRPVLYLVLLLETVGFLLFGVGLMAEMIAQLRDEVDALRRRTRPESPGE